MGETTTKSHNGLGGGEGAVGRMRVLLAEDHVMVRDGIRRILESERDIQVVGEASNGEEAVHLAANLAPDIVLMDVSMPRLDGIEATRRIKEVCHSTSVLILSAYDDDSFIFSALEAGAAGYLLKGARGSELVEALRAIYQGQSVLHPSVARKVLSRFQRLQDKPPADAQGPLTGRETEILKAAAKGASNREIGEVLGLSARTVQAHLGNIFNKLDVSSRTEAIVKALKQGLLSVEDLG